MSLEQAESPDDFNLWVKLKHVLWMADLDASLRNSSEKLSSKPPSSINDMMYYLYLLFRLHIEFESDMHFRLNGWHLNWNPDCVTNIEVPNIYVFKCGISEFRLCIRHRPDSPVPNGPSTYLDQSPAFYTFWWYH